MNETIWYVGDKVFVSSVNAVGYISKVSLSNVEVTFIDDNVQRFNYNLLTRIGEDNES